MKKAYLLLVHKNPTQINSLINQILIDNDAFVFVHVNKLNENIKSSIILHQRVIILRNNIDVHWGNESILDALIILLRTAFDYDVNFEYYSIRTGQDLQVKNKIDQFLIQNKGQIFLNPIHIKENNIFYGHFSINWPKQTKRLYDSKLNIFRIYRKALLILNFIKSNILYTKNHLPNNMKLYWGRFWGFYPKDVVEYILDFIESNDVVFQRFRTSLVPEEMFFHTIIMNSDFRKRVVFNDLCALVGHRNNHPTVVTINDVNEINKKECFFARKFDNQVDNEVILYYLDIILNSK
ncbi:MAG: beta-1,6-N-acetylglucosaminyltransferase [Bacteroidales bacterium]